MKSASPPKVLHMTLSDGGGAGIACIRLHHALRQLDIDSRVLVRKSSGNHEGVYTASPGQSRWRTRIDRLPLLRYRNRNIFAWWSVNWLNSGPRPGVADWTPDLIHAHWIGDGYLPIEWLASTGKPFVWTMHDMWPFTGGCHYAGECDRFHQGCGACPQLGSRNPQDLSSRFATRKAKAWGTTNGVFVSPSPWLAKTAKESLILRNARVEVIPNGIDGKLFSPGDQADARKQLSLPQDEQIVLTGAVGAVRDERKGFQLLTAALRICHARGQGRNWRLVVFGADTGPGESAVGIPVTYLGSVRNEKDLPAAYRAADLFALPSLQDNLPNTAIEAMACGKPVAGFRASGLATMIDDGKNGRLAEPFSPESLASALSDMLKRPSPVPWARNCRQEFEHTYAWPGPAERYARLYAEVLDRAGRQ
jgi:glycosyltransferase involved in cell wall biosynthesis